MILQTWVPHPSFARVGKHKPQPTWVPILGAIFSAARVAEHGRRERNL
jgi:hypothetical protein